MKKYFRSKYYKEIIKCELPIIESKELFLFFYQGEKELNLEYTFYNFPVIFLDKCFVIGDECYIFDIKNFRILNNSAGKCRNDYLLHRMLETHNVKQRYSTNVEELAIVSNSLHHNYFHWLLECLPRLLLYCELDLELPFLLPKTQKSFEIDSIKFLEVPDNRIRFIGKESWFVKNIVYQDIQFFTPHSIKLLRTQVLNKINFKILGRKNHRIYISRSDASCRRVANEKKIIDSLVTLDFKVITLNNCEFYKQVELFSCAEIIVAPHGAGLANIVFCTEKTLIIELFPNIIPIYCYWIIANILNLRYTFLFGKVINQQNDFNISIKDLLYVIDKIST